MLTSKPRWRKTKRYPSLPLRICQERVLLFAIASLWPPVYLTGHYEQGNLLFKEKSVEIIIKNVSGIQTAPLLE